MASTDLKDLGSVIEQCVEELFTSGNGANAVRLGLIDSEGREHGGWCRAAIVDRLCRVLESAGIILDGEPSSGSAGHVTGAPNSSVDVWGVVEIMGYNRYAGRISQSTELGVPLLRVDVPASGEEGEFTKLFGPGAIYAVTITDETTARRACKDLGRRCLMIEIEER